MKVGAEGPAQRRAGRSPLTEVGRTPGSCTPEVAAQVLSSLLRRKVTADEVRDRAVGVGLLRVPAPGDLAELTPQAVSRLLLACYRVPGQMGPGSWRELCGHWRAGRHVFVFLPTFTLDDEAGLVTATEVLQVAGFSRDRGEPCLLAGEPGAAANPAESLPLDLFFEVWAGADNHMLTAARRWEDLPRHGTSFFGGARGCDGAYHWFAAECETDAEGRILRF